jgi:hypothetical protein
MAKRGESQIKKQARKWFAPHAQEYRNLTDAAESCAWELGHDEWLDDPDHWVWELAIEYMPESNPGAAVRIPDRSLGVRLHQWHSSMGDPIYATGSLIFAGQPVPLDLLAETIDSLQSLRRRTKSRRDKAELKDLTVLLIAAGF